MTFECHLAKVIKLYFEGRGVNQIKCLAVLLDEACDHNQLMLVYDGTVGACAQVQMPVQYSAAFIKHIINHVEKWGRENGKLDEDDEVMTGIDLWYDELAKLASRAPEPFYRFYQFEQQNSEGELKVSRIKIFENENAFVSHGTTGLMTWTASQEFLNWIFTGQCEDLSRASFVVELGAGTGLLGIGILKTFQNVSKLVTTDGSPEALENCRQNFVANCSSSEVSKVTFETVDWISDTEKFQNLISKHSVVNDHAVLVGADIVFDSALIPPLLNLIDLFLKSFPPTKASCFLSCTIRNDVTMNILRQELEKINHNFAQVHKWSSEDERMNGLIFKIASN